MVSIRSSLLLNQTVGSLDLVPSTLMGRSMSRAQAKAFPSNIHLTSLNCWCWCQGLSRAPSVSYHCYGPSLALFRCYTVHVFMSTVNMYNWMSSVQVHTIHLICNPGKARDKIKCTCVVTIYSIMSSVLYICTSPANHRDQNLDNATMSCLAGFLLLN